MKEVVILVGPQGSGKSTLYLKEYKDYEYVSQDTYGKVKHFERYLHLIERGYDKIVVDRINHTYEQRNRYLSVAKNAGYTTAIRVVSEPYSECFNRILNRKGHNTLGNDPTVASKALIMFKNQYQRPRLDEADTVIYPKSGDWHILDLTREQTNRFIIVGDVHGCYDELQQLLTKTKYNPNEDIVILTGDLIDRGPKSKEVIDFVRNNDNVYAILGNHDNKFMRYLRGNPVNTQSLEQTIVSCEEYLKSKVEKTELLHFFEDLPYMITLPQNYYVVHAGINPKYPIINQPPEVMMYMNGLMADGSMSKPFVTEGVTWWWDIPRDNPSTIIYGHTVTDKDFHRGDTIAVDGGCVFGGKLRAAVLHAYDGCVIAEEIVEVDSLNTSDEDIDESVFTLLDEYSEQGYLRKVISPCENLVLYNYTDKCTFDKKWNSTTLNARGTVYERSTGKVVAQAFPKFFNFEELETSKSRNLLKRTDFKVYEKMDGSLGVIYYYNGVWNINTRGSFTSDQATEATKMLSNYRLDRLPKDMTLLVEIIYPENKIILDYGNERKLILLGAYQGGIDLDPELFDLGKLLEMETPVVHQFETIDQLIETQLNLDAKHEGFVVRFRDGYRVKFKSKEYLKIARILSNCSPLTFWESMKNGKVDQQLLIQIPEEFRPEQDSIVEYLENAYVTVDQEITDMMGIIGALVDPMSFTEPSEYYKQVGLLLKEKPDLFKHSSAVFAVLRDLTEVKNKYIMKYIRPVGNVMEESWVKQKNQQ